MKKLWYLLPTIPILILLSIVSYFADPWYLVWQLVGGVLLGFAALLGFLWISLWLMAIAEEKAKR